MIRNFILYKELEKFSELDNHKKIIFIIVKQIIKTLEQ